jgi:hypothetical protein
VPVDLGVWGGGLGVGWCEGGWEGLVSSFNYWQASCAHQPAGFALLVQACVLKSCDAYLLPTPFYCFPFTSPPVRHRVPSHFKCSLLLVHLVLVLLFKCPIPKFRSS